MGKAVESTALSMVREVVFGVGFALLLPRFCLLYTSQLQEKEADERDAAQDACGNQKITDRRQKRTGEQLPS